MDHQIQRIINLGMLAILTISALSITTHAIYTSADHIAFSLGASLSCCGLLIAYWRGWEPARLVAIVVAATFIFVGIPERFVDDEVSLVLLIPAVLALVLADLYWIVGVTLVLYLGILLRVAKTGVYADPLTLCYLMTIIAGMVLARLALDAALRYMAALRLTSAASRLQADRYATELAEALETQRQLTTTVQQLSTLLLPVREDIIVLPIIHRLHEQRSELILRALIEGINARKARVAILDISGITPLDEHAIAFVANLAKAAHWLGVHVMLAGISAELAGLIVRQPIDLGPLQTYRNLASAIDAALTIHDARLPPQNTRDSYSLN